MEALLELDILPQPDEVTCGPTCLHAVYKYFGRDVPLDRVIGEVPQLEEGGTLGVMLGLHALARGFRATIYTYNLQVFDPTWFRKLGDPVIGPVGPAARRPPDAPGGGGGGPLPPAGPAVLAGTEAARRRGFRREPPPPGGWPGGRPGFVADLRERLAAQGKAKRSAKLHQATDAYIKFLDLGGRILLEDLSPALIRRFLKRKIPILTGLSATYLYRTSREHGPTSDYDDIRGQPAGHFVVLCGYDANKREVLVADPYMPNPMGQGQRYAVGIDRLIGSILLGILTYDANLLVIEPSLAP
jgi:hypothetical protein